MRIYARDALDLCKGHYVYVTFMRIYARDAGFIQMTLGFMQMYDICEGRWIYARDTCFMRIYARGAGFMQVYADL